MTKANPAAWPTVPIDQIEPSPTNPRKDFDEAKLAELAESIKAVGVLQPLLVRPTNGWYVVPGKESGKPGFFCEHQARGLLRHFSKTAKEAEAKLPRYELVAGERRYRAAKLAAQDAVPVVVRTLTDREVLEVQYIENLQREDLHPLEEADGYRQLLDQHGYTVETLAAKLTKSEAYVYGTLKLANLPAAAREGFRQGRLSKNHCILIGRIPSPKLREKATDRILHPKEWAYTGREELRGEPLTFRDAKRVVEDEFMVELKGSPFDRKSLTLVEEAGSCEACPKRTGNNRAEYPDGRADVCTDPECFRAKVEAHKRATAERAEAKGIKVLPAREAKKVFNSFGLAYSSPYVDLAETIRTDAKQRSYKQVVGEELQAETVLVHDARGRPHYMVPKDKAREVLERKKIAGLGEAPAAGRYDWKAHDEERRVAEEQRKALRRKLMAAVYAATKERLASVFGLSPAPIADLFRGLVASELELGDHSDVDELGAVLGVPMDPDDQDGAVPKLLEGRGGSELLAMLIYTVVDVRLGHWWDDEDPGILHTAKLFGLDLKRIRKEADAERKAQEKAAKQAEATPANGQAADVDACESCGCTEEKACAGGCFWIRPGLCSRCDANGKGQEKPAKKPSLKKAATAGKGA